MPRVLAVGEPRYESVEVMNALSSSVGDASPLGVGLVQTEGDGESNGKLFLEENVHLEDLSSSMSSQPDLSSNVAGEAGFFGTSAIWLSVLFELFRSVLAESSENKVFC